MITQLPSFYWFRSVALLVGLSTVVSCQETPDERYLFFLHNRFLENHSLTDVHPEYGRMEYLEILEKFREAGFLVISEQRSGNVNARAYALGVVHQIDSLIALGTAPENITVVGTSKGGYIAQYVSSLARNTDLNFVFVASFMEDDVESIPEINYCGNVLTIHEASDPAGVSALARFNQSNLPINQFKEIELTTGLRHGFIFKALDEWINPIIAWGKGNYYAIETAGVVHKSKNLEIVRLSENLYVHTSYLKQYNNVPCNGMVYAVNGEAIVFDTPTDSLASVELISWAKNELVVDITSIVINHFHIDCLGGLEQFHQAGVTSYASKLTVELASSDRAHNDVIPQIGFSDSLSLLIGGGLVENRFFGRGHAPDNIVSYLPKESALFGGCLIKTLGAGKGSLTDADVAEWPKTVAKVKKYYGDNLDHVIPGHGKPGGIELLEYTIQLFTETPNQGLGHRIKWPLKAVDGIPVLRQEAFQPRLKATDD